MVIVYLQDLYLVIIYVAVVGPSLLLVGETKSRILNLKKGSRALAYLPLTVLPLLAFAIFAVNFLYPFKCLMARLQYSYWPLRQPSTVRYPTVLATTFLYVTSRQLF